MINLLTIFAITAASASAFVEAKAHEKRAPGTYQLHPPADTFDRVRVLFAT